MTWPGMNLWLVVLATVSALSSAEQTQSCPDNINFFSGTLMHWEAYTGNNKEGNGPDAIKIMYHSYQSAPNGTIGATTLPEYNLPAVSGISVISSPGIDPFGGFQTIPTINGYAYHSSVLLGSTSVAQRQGGDPSQPGNPTNGQPGNPANSPQGGYVRGVSYLINVPPGPATLPYTITYAYAMVLENGTHASSDQPMARAIVSTPGGVIDCASPAYFLPTNGGLDSATARANGFTPSPVPSPNESHNQQNPGQHLQDVWTKGWTEVTFDLSPYRGQQVTLTFEADNCIPGGHFAYAYFAIRNICEGLRISGDTLGCSNNILTYSIPSLDDASYDWSVPPGWISDQGSNGNTISIKIGSQPGWIVVRETNSCTILTDSLFVHLYAGALPEAVINPRDTTICYGEHAPLHAFVTTGTDYTWVSQGAFTGKIKGSISSAPFATNIVAAPEQTTDYILNIRNDGCPTSISDTFTVAVVPPIRVNAGNDTLVVVDQPLHFQATSSDVYKNEYQWSPSTDLSNPDIADPIGLYGPGINSITYQVMATDTFGCSGTASVSVTIAHTLPDIFVPNAFTPGTNNNSLFRPICIGISSLEYFGVYNRLGQLLYRTSQIGQGWDGRIHGTLQESNTFTWIVKGTDYTGRVISKKGTMVLIR